MTEQWPAYPGARPAGFSADPAASPQLRASNADRSYAVEVLEGAYGEGRLSADELAHRRSAAESAVTLGDLAPLVADVDLPMVADVNSPRLPVPYEADPPRPETATGQVALPSAPAPTGFMSRIPRWWWQMSIVLLTIWFITGVGGGNRWSTFWPIWPILGTLLFFQCGSGSRTGGRRDEGRQLRRDARQERRNRGR